MQDILTEKEAARLLGIGEATLLVWRRKGCGGPAYFKAGSRLIRYRRVDLDQWIESRMHVPGTGAQAPVN